MQRAQSLRLADRHRAHRQRLSNSSNREMNDNRLDEEGLEVFYRVQRMQSMRERQRHNELDRIIEQLQQEEEMNASSDSNDLAANMRNSRSQRFLRNSQI